VIGALIGLALVALLALLLLRQRRKARRSELTAAEADDGKGAVAYAEPHKSALSGTVYDVPAALNGGAPSELDSSPMSELDGTRITPSPMAELESPRPGLK
jgi:hypothetical protein